MELGRRRKKSVAEIPTVSMADIAFLLIIFFMVSTIFSREKGLKIVLPEKGEEVKIKPENILTVNVNPQGEVLIGDEIITIPEVRPRIEQALTENESLAVALRVSRAAPYKTMIDVFDELKLARARRISLVPVEEGR